jgi:hypothetical protein
MALIFHRAIHGPQLPISGAAVFVMMNRSLARETRQALRVQFARLF